jgi:site-specific DNA-methyltransferase (adenine-specific)
MRYTLPNSVTLFHGDCRASLRNLPDNSVDAVPCDPPYELNFMGKGWDDTGIANDPALWREIYRVLKPGGHLAAFSASRTYHRMACAIEDAGFEIRDSLMWIYGTGFPKSQNVSAFIDKELGAKRGKRRVDASELGNPPNLVGGAVKGDDRPWRLAALERGYHEVDDDTPITPAAIEFEGFGTALKPAFEPIVLARKPLSEPTVAANVLRWRTGALNIDGCRISAEPIRKNTARGGGYCGGFEEITHGTGTTMHNEGRWPANVVTDGSDEVVGMFPHTKSGKIEPHHVRTVETTTEVFGKYDKPSTVSHGDQGSAARFFYSAKASKADRAGSKHPTVKPISLMQWLARLITPPGGTVLDPFAGSGTTGAAAVAEGFSAILCERENEYVADIKRRLGAPVFDLDTALRADNKARRLLRELFA